MSTTTPSKPSLDPVSLSLYKEEKLVEHLVEITQDADTRDQDNSIELANKIVLLSDAQLIVVELLSRAEEIHDDAKLDAQSLQATKTKEERDKWELEHPSNSKFPASTYFEGLALAETKEHWKKVNKASTKMKRYKKIRDNYETKINALKKLLAALEMINY